MEIVRGAGLTAEAESIPPKTARNPKTGSKLFEWSGLHIEMFNVKICLCSRSIKAMISSTALDLPEHRKQARDAC